MDPSPIFNVLPLPVREALLLIFVLRYLLDLCSPFLKFPHQRSRTSHKWRFQRELKFQRRPRHKPKDRGDEGRKQ